MPFKKYEKIHRLGKEETDGILLGECYIQEKIDGANTSIWLDDGRLQMGSRTQNITDGQFNGFTDYVRQHGGICHLLADYPHYHLFGEWLIRHTVQYNETAYRKWYMFDIYDTKTDTWLDTLLVDALANKYQIDKPKILVVVTNPDIEKVKSYVGQSEIGEKGEGIVIKNASFVNKFGETIYAKLVTEKFKEDNGIIFGGNNKHSETYYEMYCINKYMTLARIEKIMNKIQPTIDRRLDLEHTARIIQTAYYDMITEEIWEIQKKVPQLNFKHLQRLSCKKAAQIYKDILSNSLSVAYK